MPQAGVAYRPIPEIIVEPLDQTRPIIAIVLFCKAVNSVENTILPTPCEIRCTPINKRFTTFNEGGNKAIC